MNIQGISAKGFGSFRKKVKVDFEPGKVYQVSGANGAGKSTMFIEAPYWCMTGKTFKGVKSADISNDETSYTGVVLNTDIGKIHRIRTGRSERVFVNDEEVTQERLEAIMGVNKDIIAAASLFDKSMGGFVLLEDSKKKQLISKIQLTYVDEKIAKLKLARQVEVLRLLGLEDKTYGINASIESLKPLIAGLKKDREMQDGIDEKVARENVERYKKIVANAEMFRDRYAHGLKNTDLKFESATEKLRKLRDLKTRTIERIQRYQEQLKRISVGVCPTCGTKIEVDAAIVHECHVTIGTCGQKVRDINPKIRGLDKVRHEYEKKIERLELRHGFKINDVSKYSALLKKLNHELLVKRGNTERRLASTLSGHNNELSLLYDREHECSQEIRRAKVFISAYDFWNIDLMKFRSDLFSSTMDQFVPACNYYLYLMFDGKFRVEMEARLKGKTRITDQFVTKIFEGDKEVDFKRLSSGEKKAVSMSMSLAFVVLVNKTMAKGMNFVVFDEAFDALDAEHRAKVVEMMVNFARENNKVVIIIAHEPVDNPSVIPICVKLINGGSSIEK